MLHQKLVPLPANISVEEDPNSVDTELERILNQELFSDNLSDGEECCSSPEKGPPQLCSAQQAPMPSSACSSPTHVESHPSHQRQPGIGGLLSFPIGCRDLHNPSLGQRTPCDEAGPSQLQLQASARSRLEQLPKEVFVRMLSFLSAEDLLCSAQTCSTLRRLSDDNSLWSRLYMARWGRLGANHSGKMCKALYMERDEEEVRMSPDFASHDH